jgi:exosome complex exonuclease DIS3/RRP44
MFSPMNTTGSMFSFLSPNVVRQAYISKLKGETEAGYNDRKARVAARWYQNHLKGKAKVILLTNDQEKKKIAIREGVQALTSMV